MIKEWSLDDLEIIENCPYCGSSDRNIAYRNVEDWSFYAAPGKWTYLNCNDCNALYLNNRPTAKTIGLAYSRYYTHAQSFGFIKKFKEIVGNEINSIRLNINLRPRLYLPKIFRFILNPLTTRVRSPLGFGLKELSHPTLNGTLIDVGCGDGKMVRIASLMGWDAHGLEIDPSAVEKAKKQGLKIFEGSYHDLKKIKIQFDRVLCSHVLEHVHDPLDMLNCIKDALKPGGILILSLPNSTSKIREYFGENWRGLEAPRHLSIPSAKFLKKHLITMGFKVYQHQDSSYPTILESIRIERRSKTVVRSDRERVKKIRNILGSPTKINVDFIEFVCKK
jgi:2-polyprenyl-3-methyl-5-hydroxy-6-metoxy-1,4-benzoquinol methylase